MQFNSKEEICAYFNIDPTKTEKEIIKILTQMRVEHHPDIMGEPTDEEKDMWAEIDDAKKFLRNRDTEIMIPFSEVRDMIAFAKNKDMQMASSREKLEERIQTTSQQIIKTVKVNWKPAKITSTSLAALITLIWAFPSIITEHPILNSIRIPTSFYLHVSVVWFLSLLICCTMWLFSYLNERSIKRLLDILKNEDNQFAIFSNFMSRYNNFDSPQNSFTIKDIEGHVEEWLYYDRKKQFYPFIRKLRRRTVFLNKYFLSVKDIIPEVSQMIITRALEKKVIVKEDTHTWYDSYIVNDV